MKKDKLKRDELVEAIREFVEDVERNGLLDASPEGSTVDDKYWRTVFYMLKLQLEIIDESNAGPGFRRNRI